MCNSGCPDCACDREAKLERVLGEVAVGNWLAPEEGRVLAEALAAEKRLGDSFRTALLGMEVEASAQGRRHALELRDASERFSAAVDRVEADFCRRAILMSQRLEKAEADAEELRARIASILEGRV